MPDIGSALTQKIGPFPGWAWAGLVAVGAWYFFLRGKSGATPNAAAAGSQLQSGYGLGYAQGLQAAGPPAAPTTQTSGTPPALNWHFGPPTSPNWVWRLTPSGTAAWQQNTGSAPNFTLQPSNSPPPSWLPQYSYQIAEIPPGQTLQNYLGGVGGAAKSIGSRSARLMHDAHPLIGARVPYQYHVRAIGGPANHAREVHRVALQSGVHPARLMALNPTPTGYIRVA